MAFELVIQCDTNDKKIFIMNDFQIHKGVGVNCFLYAFAMCLGVSPGELAAELTYTGQEVIWPKREGFDRLRGLHEQELVDVCINHGWAPIHIEIMPRLGADEGHVIYPFEYKPALQRFENHIAGNRAVLYGLDGSRRHAIAWDGKNVHDPNVGRIKDIGDFSIKGAFILYSLNQII